MPVSGLIITLADDDAAVRDALAMLDADPAVDLGLRRERRLAVATDTPDRDADRRLHQRLLDHPGIDYLDVTFIHFDDDDDLRDLDLPSPTHAVRDAAIATSADRSGER